MILAQSIKPISYVKNNTGKVLEQVASSGPVVITQNGEAAAVLMSVNDYDQMQESLSLLKMLSMSNKSMEEGKGIPADAVFQKLRDRLTEARQARG